MNSTRGIHLVERRSWGGGHPAFPPGRGGGFTLIELMVAMGIAAMMMLIAIPSIRAIQKPPLVRATEDFVKGCREARARAILTGRPMQLVIEGGGGLIRVEPVPLSVPVSSSFESDPYAASQSVDSSGGNQPKPLFSAQLPDEVAFRKLNINLKDVFDATDQRTSEARSAAIRFYSNGTCDALWAELLVDHTEVFRVTLDVISGQATVTAVQ